MKTGPLFMQPFLGSRSALEIMVKGLHKIGTWPGSCGLSAATIMVLLSLFLLLALNLITRLEMGKKCQVGTSLVVQQLGICLPTHGAQVRSLLWEDPTCLRSTKPVCGPQVQTSLAVTTEALVP